MGQYDHRTLWGVTVREMEVFRSEDGANRLLGSVEITLSGLVSEEMAGPSATLRLSAPVQELVSLEDAEDRLLRASRDLLQKIEQLSHDDLLAALRKPH